jgi:tRNA threonylcarbamoyladenosine biosynthesis protein TsaB
LPERTLFIGDGAVRYQALIEELLGNRACFAPAWSNNPRAVTASILASTMITRGMCSTAATLLPTYLRRSEAEIARHPALDLVLTPSQL